MVRALCVYFRRLRAPTADLPHDRLEDVPLVSNVGIDCFGTYYVHDGLCTRQTKVTKKMWVLIVVCLTSRAIHLEMLPSLDTSAFRNALSRFSAVRGVSKLIRCDQGTNFLCARKQMLNPDVDSVISELQQHQCEWKVNPAGASHFAGSWERKIGSVKRVLDGSLLALGSRNLSRDEMSTLLQEAAAIVNNTPLTEVSVSPDDIFPLTPATLLTFKLDPNPPSLENFTAQDLLSYGKRRWRRVQHLAQEFWKRWHSDYLTSLQKRHKWKITKPCPVEGDVVLIKDKNLPRNAWSMGKIISVKRSDDNCVRSVTLLLPRLPNSAKPRTTTRCIQDLVILLPSKKHPCFETDSCP